MTRSSGMTPMPERLRKLQRDLGIKLDDGLLVHALTHRSYSYENGSIPTNERFEFLGDAILGQSITVKLFRDYPDITEGELAKRRASLVSSQALAEAGRSVGLGECIFLGHGEILTGGSEKTSIIADAVEAIIGATYIGAGADAANELVLSWLGPLIDDPLRYGIAVDPKTNLQELASARGLTAPVYEVRHTGPDHDRVFVATVTVGDLVTADGSGSSKKQAEMAAALEAWSVLETD